MTPQQHLAIIGSGASAIYLLKHLLDERDTLVNHIGMISIFEKSQLTGMGMPYNPTTTDRFNMSNISSEELPELLLPFADWLRQQDSSYLKEIGVEVAEISDSEVYSRLALGRYLNAQYCEIVGGLIETGIHIQEFPACEIVDIRDISPDGELVLETGAGEKWHIRDFSG